ncbi:NAD-dependent epimerase/dehydratase family protein [Pseudoalteromonas rubra]|uniref:NAD-dependent epimerase/dehydratase family protein n=1 Tax=Pseudoalteromonas rubra TaxID=43658 RepID=A0A5S3UUY4_9GAMM|nr:NAD-dependent epimerase/dehydratase family protein [Pseudoalteromonas rubra]QPB84388.1 NAD-dependent epimerase/dehydratase family protein [Pseudoalteromonas rubra]
MDSNTTYDALVTGATGFIGNHMVHTLLEANKKVRVLVRQSPKCKVLEGLPVDIVYGTLEDRETLIAAAQNVKVIYNCAGLSSDWAADDAFFAANIRGVENVLAALEHSDAERLIHISTSDVYGYPKSPVSEDYGPQNIGLPYNRSKAEGEEVIWRAVQERDVPVTVFRPASVYGPRSMEWVVEISRLMLNKEMVLLDGGHSHAGLVYVRNLTEAMLRAADIPAAAGQAYNIRDEGEHSWKDFVEGMGQCFKPQHWKCMKVPASLAFGFGYLMEKIYALLNIKSRPLLTRHAVHLLSRNQGFPIHKAKSELGFESWVSFEAGMELTREWMRSEEGKTCIAPETQKREAYL